MSTQNEQKPFRTFEDLEVYQVAREFRIAMYRVVKRLPDFEKFGLVSQVRRAALSLTNNIAEGHGRYHYLEQIKFTLIARGSLEELMDDLNVCCDEDYLPKNEVPPLKQHGWRVYQLINGYLRYMREQKAGASLAIHESSPAYGFGEAELDTITNDDPTIHDSTIHDSTIHDSTIHASTVHAPTVHAPTVHPSPA